MANPNKNTRDRKPYAIAIPIASTTASRAFKVYKARKRVRIEGVDYINDTGLATGAAFYTGAVKNGANVPVSALFNTNSSGGAPITANTIYNGTNGTKAARTLAAGDTLTLDTVLAGGAATLPAGVLTLWVTELN